MKAARLRDAIPRGVVFAIARIHGVIVELPLVTAAEIAAEYRPGGEATVKATLRRLRERDLISAGVAEHPREVAGRVAGTWHVYSALNLDAVRAARARTTNLLRRPWPSGRRASRGVARPSSSSAPDPDRWIPLSGEASDAGGPVPGVGDRELLAATRCSTGAWFEDDVETFIQTRLADSHDLRQPHTNHTIVGLELALSTGRECGA